MVKEDKCDFCHTGEDTVSICGTLHKDIHKGQVIAGHHKCMQYSAMLVQYKFDEFGGFKIKEVVREIKRGSRLTCQLCKNEKTRKKVEMKGATSGCALAACKKTFHYYCVSMNQKTVAKRYKVSAGNKEIILYRVFCSKLHEANYRDNISDEISGQNQSSGEEENVDGNDDDNNDDDDEKEGESRGESGSDLDEKSPGNKRPGENSETKHRRKRIKTADDDADAVADDDDDEEPATSGVYGMSSPEMTTAEVVFETSRQYQELLEKQKSRDRPSSSHKNGADGGISIETDSGENVTEDFNTSNGPSPDETDVSETESILNTSEQGPLIIIPSKLEVADLKAICKKAELPVDSVLLWPPSYRALQDKQMPFIMWDIANRVRKGEPEGIAKMLSDSPSPDYNSLRYFMSREKTDIIEELQLLINDVNIKYTFEVLRLMKLSIDGEDIYLLILNLNIEPLGDLDLLSNFAVCQWSPSTVLSFSSDKYVDFALERKLLLKWLVHRLGQHYELHVFPEEDTIKSQLRGLSIARSVISKLKSNSQSLFTDCPVKVLVIQNVDRSVTKFKPYVNKLLHSFMYQHPGFECFCVMDVLPEDDIRETGDIVPDSLTSLSVRAYSALCPTYFQVSCVVLHIDRDERYTGRRSGNGRRSVNGVLHLSFR